MNRLDTLISRETLPKARTMQEHDDNRDTLTPAEDTTNGSELKVWEQRIATFVIVAAFVVAIVSAGLLIQAYVSHKSVLGRAVHNFFQPGFEISVGGFVVYLIVSCLAQIIAEKISTFVVTEQKRLGCILLIGLILLCLSFWLSFASYKLGQEWRRYFSIVTLVISPIAMKFSILINTKRKRLRIILRFVSYILLLTGTILILLESYQITVILSALSITGF